MESERLSHESRMISFRYITTLTMAEYMYRLDRLTELKQYLLSFGKNVTARMIGDQFVQIVRNAVMPNGSMHEQFGRINGPYLVACLLPIHGSCQKRIA